MSTPLRRLCLLFGLLAAWAGGALANQLEIIPLRHRTVEQVMPVLRPLLEPGATLSGTQNQLFVRASPNNLAELRRVLTSIDTPLRKLVISVRQGGSSETARRAIGASGTVGGGRVVIGNEPGGRDNARGVTITGEDSRSTGADEMVQQIQALEGSPARIQVGQSIPYVSRTVTPTARGAVVNETVTYRDVSSGFEVVPRIAGERVMLDIRPRRESLGPRGSGTVNVQGMQSSVSGKLGEWFELGGMSETGAQERSGLLSGSSAQRADTRRVWVKVEEIK